MSEYKTLKEWFGEATRGDGRKFTRVDWLENQWIEPIYLDKHKDWHCLDYEGYSRAWGSELYPFKEWHPPRVKKTYYRGIWEDSDGDLWRYDCWFKVKKDVEDDVYKQDMKLHSIEEKEF